MAVVLAVALVSRPVLAVVATANTYGQRTMAEEAGYANAGELFATGLRDGWTAATAAAWHNWGTKLANHSEPRRQEEAQNRNHSRGGSFSRRGRGIWLREPRRESEGQSAGHGRGVRLRQRRQVP